MKTPDGLQALAALSHAHPGTSALPCRPLAEALAKVDVAILAWLAERVIEDLAK